MSQPAGRQVRVLESEELLHVLHRRRTASNEKNVYFSIVFSAAQRVWPLHARNGFGCEPTQKGSDSNIFECWHMSCERVDICNAPGAPACR